MFALSVLVRAMQFFQGETMTNPIRYFIRRPSANFVDSSLDSPGEGLVPDGSGLVLPESSFADQALANSTPAAPYVSSVVFTDALGDPQVGKAGTPVSVVITFSEPVTVVGLPRFNFRIGSSGAIFYADGIATAADAAPSNTLTLKAILPSGVAAVDNGNIVLAGITLDPLRDRITGSDSGLTHANGALPSTVSDYSYLVDNSAPAAPGIVLGHGVSGLANFAEATASSGVVQVTGEDAGEHEGEVGAKVLVTFTDSSHSGHSLIKQVTGAGDRPVPVVLTAEDLAFFGAVTVDWDFETAKSAYHYTATLNPGDSNWYLAYTVHTKAPAENTTVYHEPSYKSLLWGSVTHLKLQAQVGGWASASSVFTVSAVPNSAPVPITVTATVTDAAGNSSAASTSSFTLDTYTPTPGFTLGAGVSNGANLAEATASSGVLGMTAESGSTVVITFTDSATPTAHLLLKTVIGTGAAQAITLAASDLGPGAHQLQDGHITVSATATDPAGNVSGAGSSSFDLDATAPTLTAQADGTPALSVMGKTLTLNFNETLDSSTVPLFNDPRVVQVSYTPLGGVPTNTTIQALTLHGKQLQFYLDDAIPSGALVRFRYTDKNGTDDPNSVIQDLAGNDVASFRQPVANLSTVRPTVVGVSFGDWQGDWFHSKPGATVVATLRFSENVSINGPVDFVFQVGDGPVFGGTFTPPPAFGSRPSISFSFTLPDAPVDADSHIQFIGIGSATAHNILGDYTHNQLLPSDFSTPLTDTSYWVDSTAPDLPVIELGVDIADGASHAEATASAGVLMVSAEADSSVLLTFTDHLGHGFSKTLLATGTEQPVTLTAADFGTGVAQLADGDIRVSATATDQADNSSSAASSSFVLHPTPPTAFVPGENGIPDLVFSNDTGTPGDFITSNRSQTITAHLGVSLAAGEHLWGTVNAEAETPIWVNLDGFTHGNTVTWTDVSLAEANTHTLKLEVRDLAGNAGTLLMQDYKII